MLFFKGRFSNGMESGIMVNGEIVNISDNAVHLGHTISSSERESMSLTAKSSFWKSFNSFISNSFFSYTYSFIKCSLFKQFGRSFYGSPLWNLNGPGVQSLCVDWRKSLRSLWRVHPMTHCDVIAALSDQFPIKISLERRFIRFIKKCLSSSNSIVNVISHIAICHPMSTAGENYRSVLDANGDYNTNCCITKLNLIVTIGYNTNQMVTSWQDTCESIKESIRTLRELIDVRDGYSECIGFY